MTYQQISTKLSEYAERAKQITQQLNEQLTQNMSRYLGEYLEEANKQVDSQSKQTLSSLNAQAQRELDSGLKAYQEVLDIKYFADISSQQASELEMIAKSNLDSDELRGYFRKFKDNQAIIRRLEKISNDKGYMVLGLTYQNEMDFLRGFKNLGQGVVDAILSGEATRVNISTNLLNGKIKEYEELTNKQIQVLLKN